LSKDREDLALQILRDMDTLVRKIMAGEQLNDREKGIAIMLLSVGSFYTIRILRGLEP